MKSESLDKLLPALHKAQSDLEHAKKDSSNPHFKSKYADLATVLDTCKPVLKANGLIITHQRMSLDGGEFLVTTLWHTSGQYLQSTSKLLPTKCDPQGYGSAVTYARRYDLSALIGLASDDDDGNAASAANDSKPVSKSAFGNAALRKQFCENVIKSFQEIDAWDEKAQETLDTLQQLNAEKLNLMKASGNEHDGLGLDEIRKQYALKKQEIQQATMQQDQMRAK